MCLPNALGRRVPARSRCMRAQTLSALRFSRILANDAHAAILDANWVGWGASRAIPD